MADGDTIDKQSVSKKPVAGFNVHPENINRAGRPKRKTLTELLHMKLDDTPNAWEAIIRVVMEKIITGKDPRMIKTFWQYTDGMPKQSVDSQVSGAVKIEIVKSSRIKDGTENTT